MKKNQSKYIKAILLLKATVAILQQNKAFEGDIALAKSYIKVAVLEIDAVKQ